MEEIFKKDDRVTRSKKHPHNKTYEGLYGTVVEVIIFKGYPNRYKIKWDNNSGKYLPSYNDVNGCFYPDKGQQHSTLLGKNLTKVAA